MTEDAEVMKVLESLVADNENLKHDNSELQNLLTETREDLRALQEEVEEHRAVVPSACTNNCIYLKAYSLNLLIVDTPHSTSRQYYPGSIPSSFKDQSVSVFLVLFYYTFYLNTLSIRSFILAVAL
jgi:hypothetical protein